jgi:hypothetical protein
MANPYIAGFAIVMLLVGAPLTAQAPEDAAQAAAESWLRIVDAGNYGSSWDEAATGFKATVTKERWTEAVARARAPFGGLTSRKVAARQATDNPPGAPAGKYVVVQFTTALEKSPAVETVTLMLDGDRGWRIVAYFIKPS